ncbi:MAG: phytanoyl-CoA dioxygenase family protein [Armatimonadetes bacterium]|nr:phytanoyl-CoA dioxygenase family protein [Armatimonadota bacterium]
MAQMTDEQRFLFDLQGFIVIPNALDAAETARFRDEIYRMAREEHPEAGFWDDRREPREVVNVHRPIEKSHAFLNVVDHPSTLDILVELTGGAPRLIDNTAQLTPGKSVGLGWHRGVQTYGYSISEGRPFCLMVKCIFYLSDVRKGACPTRLIPGSHKSQIHLPDETSGSDDLPGQIELEVDAGACLIFSEAVLHAGNVNKSDRTRTNMYFNYGPSWVEPWEGFRPPQSLWENTGGMRRQILGGGRVYSTSVEEARKLYP